MTPTEKNRNLVIRVVTSLVLLPGILWLIWLGGLPFALLISVAAAMCALELNLLPTHLPPQETKKSLLAEEIEELEMERAVLTGAAIVSLGGAFLLPLLHEIHFGIVSTKLVLTVVLIIAFADALVFEDQIANAPRRVSLAVLGVVYPGLLLSSLVRIRQLETGEWWIVLTLAVTWLNDTCAYFAGRAFGERKLYERISPSKTWEGAIGGALGSIAGAVIVQHFWIPQLPAWGALVIGAGAAVVGPVGDLSESLLKRAYGAKDSGRLLPGHGGMLDRIDALIFNAPFVLLCARLFA
ncbi:MAG: phosphatidate cytidylyltransferase [Myxococcales bacterium]|nr:phosphatidate cytidylyltransferase [Myxococcales bacterium]